VGVFMSEFQSFEFNLSYFSAGAFLFFMACMLLILKGPDDILEELKRRKP
jgi:hypothetical protein